MLPDHLHSSYRTYKADTDYVAHWLVTTAEKNGYSPPTRQLDPTQSPVQSSRPKGNARKSSTSVPAQAKQDRTYLVEIQDFVPLAERIAKSGKLKEQDSSAFVSVLQCCIRERSRHLAYHCHSSIETRSSEADRRHDHFIEVLKKVQKIILPVLPNPSTDGNLDITQDPTDAQIGNMFQHLSLEETPISLEETETPHEPLKHEMVKYSANLGTSEEEVQIATAMLFWDLHRLRLVSQAAWRQYLEGELDLMAASITTNTAIDFVRSIQLDFEQMFPGRVDLNKEPCYACDYTTDGPAIGSQMPLPCMQSARFVFIRFKKAYLDDTSDFVPTVAPNNIPLYYDLGSGDVSIVRFAHAFRDLKLAMGVLPEFCVLIKTCPAVQAEHELMRGLRQVIDGRKEVFWVTFAIQLFLDMRNVLREEVRLGFGTLRQQGRVITRSIKDVLHLHQTHGPTLGPQETPLRDVVELVERWIESDFVGARRKDIAADPLSSVFIEQFHLLRRDPLWCGLLLYNFRMVSYEGAIVVTNHCFSIQAAAHLYNSLRQMELLHQRWDDMECVFAAHSDNEIFVGDVPRTAIDCSKQFLLAYGVSAQMLARNRRETHRITGSPMNAKKLQKRTPLTTVFKSRFCDNDGRSNFRPKELESVLRCSTSSKAKDRDGLGVCTSLVYMAGALHREAQELCFDYFLLHKVCWTMLSRIVLDLADTNADMRFLRSNPKHLPEAVASILQETVSVKGVDLPRPTKDTYAAATIVSQILETSGNSASTAMRPEKQQA